MSVTEQRKELLQSVDQDLEKVENHVRAYRRSNTILLFGSIVAGLIAALTAGGMAAKPQVVDMAFAGSWAKGCALAGIAAAAGVAFSGLHSGMKIVEHLGNG